ncbi:hypothetical protein WJX72_008030 [[Myrmecia] bisecta]|uniref:Uncharacterized protein n=1 Tax=[Myrmecia] bisecta TaxID=41462 RepID=A0AAW1QSQ5_9CHLO
MTNHQIESELAACFDLLKVSLGKSDAVKSKSDALKSLVKAAVERGVEANELIGDCGPRPPHREVLHLVLR